MIQTRRDFTEPAPAPGLHRNRIGERRKLRVPGRLTWRDASGALRFVSVVTRDVSDVDVFVECQVPASIPLYRLVHFQIERSGARLCRAARRAPAGQGAVGRVSGRPVSHIHRDAAGIRAPAADRPGALDAGADASQPGVCELNRLDSGILSPPHGSDIDVPLPGETGGETMRCGAAALIVMLASGISLLAAQTSSNTTLPQDVHPETRNRLPPSSRAFRASRRYDCTRPA